MELKIMKKHNYSFTNNIFLLQNIHI